VIYVAFLASHLVLLRRAFPLRGGVGLPIGGQSGFLTFIVDVVVRHRRVLFVGALLGKHHLLTARFGQEDRGRIDRGRGCSPFWGRVAAKYTFGGLPETCGRRRCWNCRRGIAQLGDLVESHDQTGCRGQGHIGHHSRSRRRAGSIRQLAIYVAASVLFFRFVIFRVGHSRSSDCDT